MKNEDDLLKYFFELDRHLLEDDKPSTYIKTISKQEWFLHEYPFTMLADLEKTPQSPQHHPEGSVWNHTLMVLDNAAVIKQHSTDPRVFIWAALLHDIGKAPTTNIRKGKITSYNHDEVGRKMVLEFLQFFLKGATNNEGTFPNEDFITKVARLVRWHMQILFVVKGLPFGSIPKMSQEVPIEEVALLGYCDRMGRGEMTPQKAFEEKETIYTFTEKCEKVLGRNIFIPPHIFSMLKVN